MNNKKKDEHQFAFFVSDLTALLSKQDKTHLRISDEKLFHRMVRVLRMQVGDTCFLFNQKVNVQFDLIGVEGKKHIDGKVVQKNKNEVLSPSITFLLPLLKREHFETALYSLAELGANVVQPVITQKTQRKWGGQKEYDRLFQIIVSAAEQSKYFSFPELKEPIFLDEACKTVAKNSAANIFFDPSGEKIATVLERYRDKDLVLMVGPEGDVTVEEKKLLQQYNFSFCSLAPTVLRSLQAAALSIGIFRSFYST